MGAVYKLQDDTFVDNNFLLWVIAEYLSAEPGYEPPCLTTRVESSLDSAMPLPAISGPASGPISNTWR